MKNLARFLCAAALAVGIAGGATVTASAQVASAASVADPACPPAKPGDTEWNTPATHCPEPL
ncbi:hypothetical protein GCM10010329_26060 [Streptomyces spiroverticillatus]|uniref:Uncharacterized protein n=1 Tax=Streptomyces finlayi TaxID=67296 RepID=A0A918WVV3_9ACTN|nr:hypothetical protein [Streptomyces finlayi]GHA02772.1 hypothetical protein GCM10010329_26060 [Streptomyces spiroverticillatus]GHC87008.1 hypothetical protein GCM10010334_18470 [Streptomyces finlayi]